VTIPLSRPPVDDEIKEAVLAAIEGRQYILGPQCKEFESELARHTGVKHAVLTSSATAALWMIMRGLGVKPGDEVLTPSHTAFPTIEAICFAGATPVFVDADEWYTMDPKDAAARITPRTVGIVPVHLYGQSADMDPIMDLAAKYKMVVIEDACQAHGAKYFSKKENRWRTIGSMGHAAAFSFYPGKNLGACGEGGAITSQDAALIQKCKMIREHGQSKKYYHEMEGYNGRLDSIQAGLLRVKLRHLAKWNESRQNAAKIYQELLAPVSGAIKVPVQPSWAQSVYHLYVIVTPERDRLMEHLGAAGVGTGIHYPIPVHLQKPYRALGYKEGDYPVSERIASNGLSLPMFPQLTRSQQEHVANSLKAFFLQASESGSSGSGALAHQR